MPFFKKAVNSPSKKDLEQKANLQKAIGSIDTFAANVAKQTDKSTAFQAAEASLKEYAGQIKTFQTEYAELVAKKRALEAKAAVSKEGLYTEIVSLYKAFDVFKKNHTAVLAADFITISSQLRDVKVEVGGFKSDQRIVQSHMDNQVKTFSNDLKNLYKLITNKEYDGQKLYVEDKFHDGLFAAGVPLTPAPDLPSQLVSLNSVTLMVH